ncbi:hypothetical protein GH5_01640 [Leishmania sp. Ghana 2012 LV757]|uniref:hypothetical protein n=1 Tax=Leishmania sp. Ghana 2012 LV757 TaxID=2803181 RepID=UPI001B6A0559|nr:hypothetical protein GH5_01640 [Leishmania sp. Ghana 2012 LV757]
MKLTHLFCEWYMVVHKRIFGALPTVSTLAKELVGHDAGGRILSAYVYAQVPVGLSLFIAVIGRPQIDGRCVSRASSANAAKGRAMQQQ